MRNFKNLVAIAAASTLALGMGSAANASITIIDGATGGGVVVGDPVITTEGLEFRNFDLNPDGDFIPENNTAVVTVANDITSVTLDFDVDQAIPNGPRSRGIYDFSLMVMGNMGSSYAVSGITDPETGVLRIPANNTFDVQMGEELTFVFSGTAFTNNSSFPPGYSVAAFGNPIPVPAAGLLFGTAVVGGAIARRRKNS